MSEEAAHPVLRLSKADQRSIFLHGLLIFAATFALTIAGGAHALKAGSYVPSNAVSVPYFLTVFLLATLALLFALQISKRGTVFEVLFTIAMLSGAWFVADIFLPPGAALIAGSAVILLRFAWKTALMLNLSLLVGIAGIAASIATGLTVNALLIILTILAFYDIVAVYATKHMVRMFRGLMSRGVIFAFILTRFRPAELTAPAAGPAASSALLLGTGDVALRANHRSRTIDGDAGGGGAAGTSGASVRRRLRRDGRIRPDVLPLSSPGAPPADGRPAADRPRRDRFLFRLTPDLPRMKKIKIAVNGTQAAGKGTQSYILSVTTGMPVVSIGDLLRELQKEESERGRSVKDNMAKGAFPPDSIILPLLREWLDKHPRPRPPFSSPTPSSSWTCPTRKPAGAFPTAGSARSARRITT